MHATTPTITLVNHACVMLETSHAIVLSDPWMEGTAFHDGWALLDPSTSNETLIHQLRSRAKPVVIWYSHEHSDHFSISFLRALKQAALPSVRIVYQRTLDGRIAAFMRSQGWDLIVADPGKPINLAAGLSITVAPFLDSGDSYALLRAGDYLVLNINDCVIDTPAKAEMVLARLGLAPGELTVLLTQFGYANWIGNEDEPALRVEAAAEKTRRIAIQADAFRPMAIIPFASFVYFCHADNGYLNEQQNTIDQILASPALQPHVSRLCPLALGEAVPLHAFQISTTVAAIGARGATHWRAVHRPGEPKIERGARVTQEKLKQAADAYRSMITRTFAGLNRVLEWLGMVKPVTFDLVDGAGRYTMSYASGLQATEVPAQISCTSEVLHFILSNDFGFNTLMVNGRFRATDAAAYRRAWRFFVLQDLKKMGFGVHAPITTLRLIARNAGKFIRRRIG